MSNPILKGRGGRDSINGASIKSDKFTHLSTDCGQTTICGHSVESFMLTYADVEIDCPECSRILRKEPK